MKEEKTFDLTTRFFWIGLRVLGVLFVLHDWRNVIRAIASQTGWDTIWIAWGVGMISFVALVFLCGWSIAPAHKIKEWTAKEKAEEAPASI